MASTCPKCLGSGKIQAFSHIAAGDCFFCGATGRIDSTATAARVTNSDDGDKIAWVMRSTPRELLPAVIRQARQDSPLFATRWKPSSRRSSSSGSTAARMLSRPRRPSRPPPAASFSESALPDLTQRRSTVDLYAAPAIERYEVGEHTLWRVAGLTPIKHGRAVAVEASILPEDYPEPAHDGQPLVVACGMGVDSVAMLVEMHRRGIRPDLIMWADTGSEHRATYRYIGVLQAWLRSVGFPPICIVRRHCPRAGHRSLYDQLWNCETIPSPAFHRNHSCSIEWKLKPQRRYHAMLPWLTRHFRQALGFEASEAGTRRGLKVTEAIGIEASETARRSIRYAVDNTDDYEQYYPLIEWDMDRQDCLDSIAAAGLPSPGKSACFMCPVSKGCELSAMRQDEPENLDAALGLEDRYQRGRNWRPEGSTVGLGMGARTWSDMVREDHPDAGVGLAADRLEDPEIVDPAEQSVHHFGSQQLQLF